MMIIININCLLITWCCWWLPISTHPYTPNIPILSFQWCPLFHLPIPSTTFSIHLPSTISLTISISQYCRVSITTTTLLISTNPLATIPLQSSTYTLQSIIITIRFSTNPTPSPSMSSPHSSSTPTTHSTSPVTSCSPTTSYSPPFTCSHLLSHLVSVSMPSIFHFIIDDPAHTSWLFPQSSPVTLFPSWVAVLWTAFLVVVYLGFECCPAFTHYCLWFPCFPASHF